MAKHNTVLEQLANDREIQAFLSFWHPRTTQRSLDQLVKQFDDFSIATKLRKAFQIVRKKEAK